MKISKLKKELRQKYRKEKFEVRYYCSKCIEQIDKSEYYAYKGLCQSCKKIQELKDTIEEMRTKAV